MNPATAYSLVLVASNIYTLDPVRSLPELAVRGKAFLRSSWIEDATLAKAAGPILYFGVLAYLTAEWAMLSFPGFRSASTYFIVFLAGSAFALCMETLQVFFRSRVPLRSDILFGAVGCGTESCSTASPVSRSFVPSVPSSRIRRPS